MRLFLKGIKRRFFKRLFFFLAPSSTPAFNAFAFDRSQNPRCLRAPHHGNPAVGPSPKETRLVGAPCHSVVTGAIASADDHGDFGHRSCSDSRHHFRPMAGDPFVFVFLPHHESGDILQKHKRDFTLAAKLYEMRPFL